MARFTFDSTVETALRELKARQWITEGIRLEYSRSGPGLMYLKTDLIHIFFCRNLRGEFPAAQTITLPKRILSVFDDESGPSYYTYVGTNWEVDQTWWYKSIKVNSKLNHQPRKYLVYKGSSRNPNTGGPEYNYPYMRRAWLVNDTDLGREYAAEGSEPKYFETSKILAEFDEYLKAHLLTLFK